MAITLVVEDGSGDPDANAYASAEFIAQYHIDRNNAYWASIATDDLRAACIVNATSYIDKRFKRRFRGYRMQKDQALAWPRIGAYDDDDYSLDNVPKQVMQACAEYALRAAIYHVLAPDPIRTTPDQDMSANDPNGDQTSLVVGPVKSKTEKVGPLEESTTYEGVSALTASNTTGSRSEQSNVVNDIYIPQYPEADLLLEELFDSSMTVTLERA